MAMVFTSVKNTFVHADFGSPNASEMGSDSRRRASSTPPRVAFGAAGSEAYNAHSFGARGLEDFPLLPHDDDDYTSMHAHPGPSPLEMDLGGMLGDHAPGTDTDDHLWGLSVLQPNGESTPDLVNVGRASEDTLNEEMEVYSASALAHNGWAYGAQLPNDNYRESLAQDLALWNAAPMTTYEPEQSQIFSTSQITPREEQRDFDRQSESISASAGAPGNVNHEETQGEEERTTVMLMNVPRGYTNSKLMRTIDSEGFASMYDFIYVPMGAVRTSKGYAFLNFVTPLVAQRFLNTFNGFSRWLTSSKNVCHVDWAKKHQGLRANIDRYRNSTVMGKSVPDEYKPRIFKNGGEIPFPLPDRTLMPKRRVGQPQKTNRQQVLWF